MSQTPSPFVSQYPFSNVEGNLFTPVTLKSHWDPTSMLRHILPSQQVTLPQDFRPLVKVCKQYVTSGPAVPSPMPKKDMVFPTGGKFYPPGRYSHAIDKESVLRTLNRKLDSNCLSSEYIPKESSNMYVAGSTLPDRKATANAFVSELAMPQALLRLDGTTCRSGNDTAYFDRSSRLFNNPTKQDRYGAAKFHAHPDGLPQGQPMPHGAVFPAPPTEQAKRAHTSVFTQPGGSIRMQHPTQVASAHRLTTLSNKGDISVVGVATSGSAAPVW